jgi:hypothetical protein
MKPARSRTRIGVHLRSSAVALLLCGVAEGTAAQSQTWQCAPSGSGTVAPALAEAARDYLGRVEAIYPHQVLGLVRAGDRYYLLNSRDVEWGERTRLYLLALRLREPYLTPERQETSGAPGSPPPTGSFVCLAASRAEREGLTRTPFGEVVLAAGQSLHLVDPHERQVAVEVRAGRDQPLNLGEIFHRSARAGIYAGLTGQMSGPARQPAGGATIERPDGTLIFRTASAGGSVVETRVAPQPDVRQAAPVAPVPDAVVAAAPELRGVDTLSGLSPKRAREERPSAVVAVAPAPPPVAPEKVAVAAPPPEREPPPSTEPPAPVAVARPAPVSAPPAPELRGQTTKQDIAQNHSVEALSGLSPKPEIVARPAPAAPAVLPSTRVMVQSVPAGAVPAAYDDYAKAMKTLMALKRSRSVLSVGEMTYVHPAVEVFRGRPQ